jgi:hypothetical protein
MDQNRPSKRRNSGLTSTIIGHPPKPSRVNKMYRCPPTPPPDVQYAREQSFTLDCNAVSNISTDYSSTNPKLGSAIPPYSSYDDPAVKAYFDFYGVRKTLKTTNKVDSNDYASFLFSIVSENVR